VQDRNVECSVENSARAPSDPALPIDDACQVSIDSIYRRHSPRLAFGNPAAVTTTTRGAPSSGGSLTPRHSNAFRDACASMLLSSVCRIAISVNPSRTWDKDSRSLSSHGSAADRLFHHRTSRTGLSRYTTRFASRFGYALRNRKSSLQHGWRKGQENNSCLHSGPRAAEAFAATGFRSIVTLAKMTPRFCKRAEPRRPRSEHACPLAVLRSRKQAFSRVPGAASLAR
jgi:hypothetical protein